MRLLILNDGKKVSNSNRISYIYKLEIVWSGRQEGWSKTSGQARRKSYIFSVYLKQQAVYQLAG